MTYRKRESPSSIPSIIAEYAAFPSPMTIQFIIALAIAPLVAFLAWRGVRFRLAAKAKAYEAKKHRARIEQQLGGGHPPSWHEKAHRQEEFFDSVEQLATRKGVPSSYAQTVLGKEVNVRRLSWYSGALEDQGASWLEQQMAVADQVFEWWATEERGMNRFID